MSSAVEKNCTFLISTERYGSVTQEDICADLESNEVSQKVRGLKNAIMSVLSNENMPRVLMTVIRFCITQEDHLLKKLLMLYWEVVPKCSPDGKLLPEMILVCNALRNDLISPNEYIRGSMLRFVCKMRDVELLEPLVPTVKANLEHRHSYVRRNAALAVYSIHHHFGDQLMPDATELIERFIANETDVSARRNAFLMLFNEAENIALDFLVQNLDKLPTYGDGFALLVLELARKVCRRDATQKARFMRCLADMLKSDSQAVAYEAAWTLVSLSTAPTAVRGSAATYTHLLNTSTDNNVKMIVLDRLMELKKHHSKVLQEVLMDILRALSSPNIHICKKTLALGIELVGPRNIEEVIGVFKREVLRTQQSDMEHAEEYKSLLIDAIHKCAMKYAEVVDSVVLVMLDFMSGEGAYNVLMCVKSILEMYPSLRAPVLRKIINNLDEITHSDALRVAIWTLGEYADTLDSDGKLMLEDAFQRVVDLMGEPPFTQRDAETKVAEETTTSSMITKNVVLSDGTYVSVTSVDNSGAPESEVLSHMRRLLCGGDINLGTVVVVALTKLTLKCWEHSLPAVTTNRLTLSALLIAAGVGKLAENKRAGRLGVHADCLDRLTLCCRMMLDPNLRAQLADVFTKSCHSAYSAMVLAQKAQRTKAQEVSAKVVGKGSKPDDLIHFRQLRTSAVQGGLEADLMDADDISRAVGADRGSGEGTQLRHIYQLTGYSDPVYAEATVTVHEYDILLDMLIINRTPNTLTNLTVELATIGDLKILERPQTYTLSPNDERRIRSSIKISSTETGHIFGTIVFDITSSAAKHFVQLSDIQLDIMDYIRPGECKEEAFRSMWAEFEWENKVVINTNLTDLHTFLDHIVSSTNMTCLTPFDDKADFSSNFLAANLYARSVFGEDALVNVSVEKKEGADGRLSGFIRIRSKTQGIALSLGDRITSVQRVGPSTAVATM